MTFSVRGAPPLLNAINYPVRIINTARAISALFNPVVDIWGIYLDNKIALPFDAVESLDLRDSANISNALQEGGAFISYNKIQEPYQARLRVLKKGTASERNQFLAALEKIIKTTSLYQIVTPDYFWENANVVLYEIMRNPESGLELLTVEIVLQEVMLISKPEKKTDPNNAPQKSGGQVVAS